jgi:NADH:ubiquinone oxidoreductase subunit 6 (subunit J)
MTAFILAAAVTTVSDQEAEQTERWVSNINLALLVLIVALLGLAVAVRYIARHTTQPCRWCMEFIPKRAAVCPRCGKSVTTLKS